MFQKEFKAVNNFLAIVLYSASLGSPVIGAVVGGLTHGLIGAGIGLFAGPLVAVATVLVYAGVNRLFGTAPSPSSQHPTPPLAHRLKEAGKGLLRGFCWGLNLSVYVGTLGRVNLNLDGPRETNYNANPPPSVPPAAHPGSLTDLSLKKAFPDHSAEAANNPATDSPKKQQEPRL